MVSVVARTIAHAKRQGGAGFVHCAHEPAPSPGDDNQSITQALGMRHDMRRQDDGCAAIPLGQDQGFEATLVDRVEPRKRFVEHDQFGIMHHGADDLDHLGHALGQFADLLWCRMGEAKRRQPFIRTGAADLPWQASQRTHEGDGVARGHAGIEAPLFGEIADTVGNTARAIGAQQAAITAVGINHAEQHAQRRGFPGTVGAEHAIDRAARDAEINPRHGLIGTEAFAQPLGNHHCFVQACPHHICHAMLCHDAADYRVDVKKVVTVAKSDMGAERAADALTARIRSAALGHGFADCRFARADAAPKAAARLRQWLDEGCHGDMLWMEARADERASPAGLWPEVRSVIMLGMSYAPAHDPLALEGVPDRGRISVYAQGQDYHDVVKRALKAVARDMVAMVPDAPLKVFVDTAPVMEKPLAEAAGLGWQGKHSNLVSQAHGSWLFLGAIYTTLELVPDTGGQDRCGSCDACQRACPTDAFPAPYRVDARRCISYLTIEHKGPIPVEFRKAMGNRIYGCDDCLAVCPWNKFAQSAATNRAFLPRAELVAPSLDTLLALDDASFRAVFAGSPIKRIGRNRMVRNAAIAAGNSGEERLKYSLESLLDDGDTAVAEAARWALDQMT